MNVTDNATRDDHKVGKLCCVFINILSSYLWHINLLHDRDSPAVMYSYNSV